MPHGLRYTEWALQALAPLGLDLRQMVHICVLIFSHTKGLANDFDLDLDELFEFGLQRLLDGREGWLAARG